jgi:hypothetical protein
MADSDDLLDLWQSQSSEGFRMSAKEIRVKAEQLDKALTARTRAAYQVCAFLIIAFSWWAVIDDSPLLRVGAALTVASVVYLGYQVHQNRFRRPAADAIASRSLEHLREELTRQRDFHRGRRFWSRLLFLASAGFMLFAGFAKAHPEVITMIRIEVVTFAIMIIAAIVLNRRMARKYQRQLNELGRQEQSS